jgi:hypothetical protein
MNCSFDGLIGLAQHLLVAAHCKGAIAGGVTPWHSKKEVII